MSLKVEINNVGGIFNKNITLEKGVNRIRAPNAVGKTSFTKSLELLAFSDPELRGKGSYSNLFVGSEEPISIKLSGDINHERNFKRIGNDDLKEIGTEALVQYSGKRIVDVCFAMPGNHLLDDFIAGKDVKSYVEMLAGSENYEKALKAVDEILNTTSAKIRHYNDSLIRLEELKKQRAGTLNELKTLNAKFSKMPLLDQEETSENHELFQQKQRELDKVREEIAKLNVDNQTLEEKIENAKQEIKWFEQQIQLIKSRSPRIDARLSWIANEIPVKKSELSKIRAQKAKAQDKLSSAQRNEVSLTKYGDEGLCYACGKRMSTEELHSWINKIKTEISELNSINTSLRREIEDLQTEQQELKEDKQDLAKYEDDLKSKQKSLANREDDEKRNIKKIKGLESNINILMEDIHKLSRSEEAYNQFKEREEMKARIDQEESTLNRTEVRVKDLNAQTAGISDLQDKLDFIQQVKSHLKSRKNQIVDEIRGTFDKRVTELYKKLGYSDFDDIEIGPNFKVSVTRKKDGRLIENFPLEALSTSERFTIAIAFLIAAKEEYVSDFPFFVLDEIITSYDPERFKQITDYLKNNDQYTIITELVDDTNDLEVIHDYGSSPA